MEMQRNSVVCLVTVMLLLVGCQKPADTTVPGDTTTVAMVLCGKCGHEKGSAQCCADDCETCAICGLHVGSQLCCKVAEEFRGNDMCLKCGHIAGSDECCKDGCVICTKCGLHEGSPLCCKLTAAAETETDEAMESETAPADTEPTEGAADDTPSDG
jgi:hypothetical protein